MSSLEAAAKPNPEFFQLPTHGDPVKDRASNLHFALCELLRLVFEHRELDLGDDETYALNVVTKLLVERAEHGGWELVRVRITPDGTRRVILRRKIIRAVRTA